MKTLTYHLFDQWLEHYGKYSRENDARASSELFAEGAHYYESPFDEPMIGREAIYQYWDEGAQAFKDKTSTHEILAVKDNQGIARWQSSFVHIHTGKQLALDCIFQVEFDGDGYCRLFREWWHLRETPAECSR